jgi:hypothetical protein
MIEKDVLLTSFNSFGVAVKAPLFASVDSEKSLVLKMHGYWVAVVILYLLRIPNKPLSK